MSASPGSGDDRLVRVRRELRALGYLEGYLERYLLSDLFARPGLLRPALSAALRVALAGGTALAFALTAAQVAWSPTLAARPAEALVFAGFVLAVTLPSAFALALAAGLGVLLSRRRPAVVAGVCGAVVSAILLADLLPWWWFRASARGGLSPGNLAVLALLAAAALLQGRLAALAALVLGLTLRGGGEAAAAARHDLRPAAWVLGGVTVALALLAIGLLREPPEPAPQSVAWRPTGTRVAVVAVDGLALGDRRWLADLEAKFPARAEVPLARLATPVPPVVWTTVATGRDPLAHGVRSLLVERLPGIDTAFPGGFSVDTLRALAEALLPVRPSRSPLSERLRREKAYWEVADAAGVETVVVNWWATYPAHLEHGTVVSERAFAALAAGRALTREVWPEGYGRALAEVFPALGPGLTPILPVAEPGGSGAATAASRADGFHARLAIERARDPRVSLVTVYLQALDVLWSESAASSRQLGEGEGTSGYADFVTGLMGELAHEMGESGVVILVGDPGRARPGEVGILLLAGGAVKSGGRVAEAHLEDIAPTVLALLGLPASAEMRGEVLTSLLSGRFVADHPPRRVSSFGRRAAVSEVEEPVNDAVEHDRLRALGYVN